MRMQTLSVVMLISLFCLLNIDGREVPEMHYIIARNPFTGRVYFKDLEDIEDPTPVRRIRIMIGRTKAETSTNELLNVYNLKISWLFPENWFDGFNPKNRKYNIVCKVQHEDSYRVQEFLNVIVDGQNDGFAENFLIRGSMRLGVRCKIRAINSVGLQSKWTSSGLLMLAHIWPSDADY